MDSEKSLQGKWEAGTSSGAVLISVLHACCMVELSVAAIKLADSAPGAPLQALRTAVAANVETLVKRNMPLWAASHPTKNFAAVSSIEMQVTVMDQ